MPEIVCCPKCASQNVMFSCKRKLHVCEDCGHEFIPTKPFAPLRIFLSYGHDSSEELVLRIKADLDRKDAAELFDYLLANPLRSVINGGRERYLIVIDALDEAGEAGRNPLVEMLARNAQRLPDWLGLVVISRPEFDVKTPLQALNPFPLDTQSKSNRP